MSTKQSLHVRAAIVFVAATLVAAACGGGGTKKPSATPGLTDQTTTTAAPDVTTTTLEGSGSQLATTTTSAPASNTVVTKKPTGTTKSPAVTVTPKAVSNVATNLTNITTPPTTQPNASIQPGGTITYMTAGERASLDPIGMSNTGGDDGPQGAMIYDFLIYTNTKDGSIVPRTAESLTTSDAVVWTLKLRPNIKFSDGTPYDATAVKFNWQRLQDPKNAAKRANQANLIGQMDVVDAQTLKLTLKSKNAVFPIAVTLMPFIGSPAAIQKDPAAFPNNPIGAGPFIMKSWTRDSQMVLQRNPSYWNSPQPYLDQVIVKPVIDENSRINAFLAGESQVLFVGANDQAQRMEQNGSAAEFPLVLNGGKNVYFNLKNPPFNDTRVRQAVTMAIDPKDYANVVDLGLQRPLDSIFRVNSPFYDPTIVQLPYDPVKAQQLFDSYVADKGPINITLAAFASPANYQLAAQYVQAKLNTYKGVKVDLLNEGGAQHNTNCMLGNFAQACQAALIFDDPEPQFTSTYLCGSVPSPTSYCNTKFDQDVLDNQVTLSAQQRIVDIKDAQKQFYADPPTVFLDQRYSWHFGAKNLQDFSYADDGTPLFALMWLKR